MLIPDTPVLTLLIALGLLVNVYGLGLLFQVHREVRDTVRTTRLTLEAALAMLGQVNE